jgi:hypothetical protein
LGYSLQSSRLLDHLLRGGPGVVVSLEVVGDTSVVAPDGSVEVEELKSRTTPANPISDRAIDFWKTMRNWVDAVIAGTLNPSATRFRLYVTRPFTGGLASQFSFAVSQSDAAAAIASARDALLHGEDPVRLGTELREHLDVVFAMDEEVLGSIVQNFQLEFGSGRSWDDLRGAIGTTFIPPECAEDVLRGMSGWITERVQTSIEVGQPASILWDDFRTAILTLVRRFDRQVMLASVATRPDAAAMARELQARTYVRQLELIGSEHEDCIRAVTDFLLAEADRVEWARRGTVLEDSFDVLEEELITSWRNFKRRCDIAYAGHPVAERGQLLYVECSQHRVRLGQSDPPDHFCRGSFHKLSDAAVIGWHPEYAALLASDQADRDDSR